MTTGRDKQPVRVRIDFLSPNHRTAVTADGFMTDENMLRIHEALNDFATAIRNGRTEAHDKLDQFLETIDGTL